MSGLRSRLSVLSVLAALLTGVLAACAGDGAVTILPDLVVSGVTPDRVPLDGGTVTIAGEHFFEVTAGRGFPEGLSATVCGVPLEDVQVVGAERTVVAPPTHHVTIREGDSLTGVLPPIRDAGSGDVVVTRPDGQTVTLEGAVACFDPAPRIVSFTSTPEVAQAGVPVLFTWSVASPADLPLACTLDPGDGSDAILIPDCRTVTSVEHTFARGTYAVTLTVTDDSGATATSDITIDADNAPPVATPLDLSMDEDGAGVPIVLEGTDPDGDSLRFEVVSGSTNGTLTGTAPALTYTPGPDWYGVDSFSFRVEDGHGGSDTATVTITVRPENTAPTFTSTGVTFVTAGESYVYDIVTDDPDAADTLTVTATTLPSWLSFTDGGDGTATLAGTPDAGAIGAYEVVVTVSDGRASVEQAFRVDVVARTVVTNTEDGGVGSLRWAIAEAPRGGTVTFYPPVFGTARTIDVGAALLIDDKPLTIEGSGEDLLTLDGGGSGRVIQVWSATNDPGRPHITITDLTITNGAGGIDNWAQLTLRDVTVTDNHADWDGGGIRHLGYAPLTLIDTTVTNNTTFGGHGGGIYNWGTLILENSTITNNRATGFSCTYDHIDGTGPWTTTGSCEGGGIFNEDVDTITIDGVEWTADSTGALSGISGNGPSDLYWHEWFVWDDPF